MAATYCGVADLLFAGVLTVDVTDLSFENRVNPLLTHIVGIGVECEFLLSKGVGKVSRIQTRKKSD